MYTEANTCLYTVKWVYTRRQTGLQEKANEFALYLASDLYCTFARLREAMFMCSVGPKRRLMTCRVDIDLTSTWLRLHLATLAPIIRMYTWMYTCTYTYM